MTDQKIAAALMLFGAVVFVFMLSMKAIRWMRRRKRERAIHNELTREFSETWKSAQTAGRKRTQNRNTATPRDTSGIELLGRSHERRTVQQYVVKRHDRQSGHTEFLSQGPFAEMWTISPQKALTFKSETEARIVASDWQVDFDKQGMKYRCLFEPMPEFSQTAPHEDTGQQREE